MMAEIVMVWMLGRTEQYIYISDCHYELCVMQLQYELDAPLILSICKQ